MFLTLYSRVDLYICLKNKKNNKNERYKSLKKKSKSKSYIVKICVGFTRASLL